MVELQTRIQHFSDQAQQLLNQKSQELLGPIQRKALDALRIVSKENGYNFVFEKHGLYIYPDAEDLLPLIKEKTEFEISWFFLAMQILHRAGCF
ncbi:MAG TPA: OmpH family outer membrane protein [Puia sp.]|nr:OmpH family outer membrane protein [Puia sp.]